AEVEAAVARAKELMSANGQECNTTASDVMRYFAAYPYMADMTLDVIIKFPLLVVHEMVEIEGLKRFGIQLDRDSILNDPVRVEEAHYQAAILEMNMAYSLRDCNHVKMRLGVIRTWLLDDRIDNGYKALYAELYARVISMLDELAGPT
ncbi:MAG: hypothetical protein MUO84_04020, partial [Thermoplasmata archaeon]|nr:hypothetical protein [Thermoplasmata archaeon]